MRTTLATSALKHLAVMWALLIKVSGTVTAHGHFKLLRCQSEALANFQEPDWRAPHAWVQIGRVGLRAGPARLLGRIGTQVAEELLDLARQRLGRGRELAGCGEDGSRRRVGGADGVAERTD